jgi:hypothetical protein
MDNMETTLQAAMQEEIETAESGTSPPLDLTIDKTKLSFYDLPVERRVTVYRHLLHNEEIRFGSPLSEFTVSSILEVTKFTRKEAAPIFYQLVNFRLEFEDICNIPNSRHSLPRALRPAQVKLIENMTFSAGHWESEISRLLRDGYRWECLKNLTLNYATVTHDVSGPPEDEAQQKRRIQVAVADLEPEIRSYMAHLPLFSHCEARICIRIRDLTEREDIDETVVCI